MSKLKPKKIKFKWSGLKGPGSQISHFHIVGLGDFRLIVRREDGLEDSKGKSIVGYQYVLECPCDEIHTYIFQTYMWKVAKDNNGYFDSALEAREFLEYCVTDWFNSLKVLT